jgi:hypothetical protein
MAAHGRVAMMVRDSDEAGIAMYAGLGLTYRHQQMLGVRLSSAGES